MQLEWIYCLNGKENGFKNGTELDFTWISNQFIFGNLGEKFSKYEWYLRRKNFSKSQLLLKFGQHMLTKYNIYQILEIPKKRFLEPKMTTNFQFLNFSKSQLLLNFGQHMLTKYRIYKILEISKKTFSEPKMVTKWHFSNFWIFQKFIFLRLVNTCWPNIAFTKF